jgi:hypothetical protein
VVAKAKRMADAPLARFGGNDRIGKLASAR